MYDQFPKQTQDRRLQHQGTSPQRSPYRSEVELSITAVVNHLSYCRARTHTHTHTHTSDVYDAFVNQDKSFREGLFTRKSLSLVLRMFHDHE